MCQEEIAVYFEVLSQNFPGAINENLRITGLRAEFPIWDIQNTN
jgi:hypothetical protein